jgi:hypothetical protein
MSKKHYYINTPLQCSVYTLDYAKYWYVKLIYDFMYKAFDKERFHFVEGDTDSMYFAVSGSTEHDFHQGFSHIIKDKEFNKEIVYKWFPDPSKGEADKKKLLKYSVENEGEEMIALGPKCYYLRVPKRKKDVMKVKGGSLARNPQINKDSYLKPIHASNAEIQLRKKTEDSNVEELTKQLQEGIITMTNCSFQRKRLSADTQILCNVEVHKNAITPKHNKVMTILENQSCVPFVLGLEPEACICR